MLFVLFTFFSVKAQYRFAVGVNAGTTGKVKFDKSLSTDSLFYEVSLKVITPKYLHIDLLAGKGKDYFTFTILSEYHKPVFYPLDFYLGLGAHAGSYKDSHWTDGAAHKKVIGGLDGVLGLQLTFRPIAFSVGTRAVYNLWPDDLFSWYKHAGLRICF